MSNIVPPLLPFRIKTSEYNTSNLRDLAASLSQAFTSICSSGAAIGVLGVNLLNVNTLNCTGASIANLSVGGLTVTGATITNLIVANETFTNLTGTNIMATNETVTNLTVTNIMTGNIMFSSQNQLDNGMGNVIITATGPVGLQINLQKPSSSNSVVIKNLTSVNNNFVDLYLQGNSSSSSKANWAIGTDNKAIGNQDLSFVQNFVGRQFSLGYNVIQNIYTGATGACSSLKNLLDDGVGNMIIAGNFAITGGSIQGRQNQVATPYTGTANDYIIGFTGTTNTFIALAANVVPGITYKILNNGSGNLTMTGPSFISGTGAMPFTLLAGHSSTNLTSDGLNSYWLC